MQKVENAYLTFKVIPAATIDTSKVTYIDLAFGAHDMELIYEELSVNDDIITLTGFRDDVEQWELDLINKHVDSAHLIIQDNKGNEIEIAAHAQLVELIDLHLHQ